MTCQLPPSTQRLLDPGQLLPFQAAYDVAIEAGNSEGAALLKGFQAVQPERVVLVKCRLELLRKRQADQVFYAWASVVEKDGVEVSDHEGDGWDAAGMEVAAWDFCARGGAHGISHRGIATDSELVGSMAFTKDLQDALGIDLGRVGWVVGFRVGDVELWDDIDNGRLPMVSIGGSGYREPVT